MARRRIAINWEEFDKLCALQCTRLEIASWFNCSVDTIERACKRDQKKPFAAYYEEKAGKGKIALRRLQFQSASAGTVTMQIWLGKQWLGQSDKMDSNVKQNMNLSILTEAREHITSKLAQIRNRQEESCDVDNSK